MSLNMQGATPRSIQRTPPPDEGHGVARGFISMQLAASRRSQPFEGVHAGIEDTLGCSKGFRFL